MKKIQNSRFLLSFFFLASLIFACTNSWTRVVNAQGENPDQSSPTETLLETEELSPYFSIQHLRTSDGKSIDGLVIKGPSKPPPEFTSEYSKLIDPNQVTGIISDFPSYDWVFGCSAVSGAMIAAYWDRNGYPNIYTGSTNGGVMPLTDTSWSTWTDGYVTYPNNPLIASHNGVDGRNIKGSIDDYWIKYGNTANDPYISGSWTQHAWGSSIGDYMKTSQSVYNNSDGSTTFFSWTNSADPLTCTDMEDFGFTRDGTYGRKLFYEARDYAVTDCYNRKTDNIITGGFSLANFQAEIDAGHPVLLNLAGHSIVGYGYDGSTIYLRNTWDSNSSHIYTMTWGGNYSGMALQSVSVVTLADPSIPSTPNGVSATDGNYTDKVQVSWNTSSKATFYKVYRNTAPTSNGSSLLGSPSASLYNDTSATAMTYYYYFVKACNSAGCSGYSAGNQGYRALAVPSIPTGVSASDGTYTDSVRVSWSASSGATQYEVYRNTTNNSAGAILWWVLSSSPYNDTSTTAGIVYYYFIKACNSAGCSAYSTGDSGYRAIEVPEIPTGVNATDGSFPDKVQISWNASNGATYFQVYRNTSNTSIASILLGSPSASPFDDTGATAGTTYYYFVKSCNAGGCSDYSTGDSGYWVIEVVIPPAPTGMSASDGTYTTKVQVSWSVSAGATYYQLYRNTTNASSGAALVKSPTGTSTGDTTATKGNLYWYFVKACNTSGCSAFSKGDSGYRATTANVPILVKPSGTIHDTTPTYQWTKVSNATKYRYQLFAGTTRIYIQTPTSTACTVTYCTHTPTTKLANKVYKWRVSAYRGRGVETLVGIQELHPDQGGIGAIE